MYFIIFYDDFWEVFNVVGFLFRVGVIIFVLFVLIKFVV